MKRFIYTVCGMEFEDKEAFGIAWRKAVEVAKTEHCEITRTVISGDNIRYEFFASGNIFLNNRFWDNAKVKIF